MANYLGFPFDPEIFSYQWQTERDPVLTAMFESGAVVTDPVIANLISKGSDTYTIPFTKTIGGTPENYNGQTDITTTETSGDAQTGIVYGRAHGWVEREFVLDYNSGVKPLSQAAIQVSKYWQKVRQKLLIGILNGIFSVTSPEGWKTHITDISAADTSVNPENKLGATSFIDAAQKALGDNSGAFSLAIMHSRVAANLAGLNLLEYAKYTDARGIERPMKIGYVNGLTVVIDDGVPYTPADSAAEKYTTYLFGEGAIRYAPAPVETPSETARDAKKNGGENALITRIRETIHPNGFSFTKPGSGYNGSPDDTQLFNQANWKLVADPKNVAIAKIVSNG